MNASRKLRALFHARLDDTAARTLAAGEGEVPSAEIESLSRLSKLCDLAEASARREVSQWQLFLLLAIVLILVTVLVFVEVSSTEISGNAQVSTLTFRLAKASTLSKGWSGLSSAGISEAERLQAPALGSRPKQGIPGGIVLLESLPGKRPGDITIPPLILPEGTTVTLEADESGSYTVQLKTETATLSMKLNADGAIRVKGLGRPEQVYNLAGGAGFTASAGKSLTFSLHPSAQSRVAFQPLLPVNLLEFSDIEIAGEGSGEQTMVRSTVRSGSVFLEELGAREHKLREAEDLRFEGLNGTIRSVTLRDGAIIVNFEGRARKITSHARSLKPSLLEFLRAQKPVELLWGSALGLFGAILAALRWLKVEV